MSKFCSGNTCDVYLYMFSNEGRGWYIHHKILSPQTCSTMVTKLSRLFFISLFFGTIAKNGYNTTVTSYNREEDKPEDNTSGFS